MDQKWTKYSYVCTSCDSLFEITCLDPKTYEPQCCGFVACVSVVDATIKEKTKEEVPPMDAQTQFETEQAIALKDLIEKKDAYIMRLQDEISQKSSYAFTVNAERQNLVNTMKEFVIESINSREMMQSTAEAIAEIMGFELTKKLIITATVDFEVEIEIGIDEDADDVVSSLEFSVDSYNHSIDDYSVDIQSTNWEDDIS